MKARGLHELAAMKKALQDARREQEALAARRRESAAAASRERELFSRTVGAVLPLRKDAAPLVARPRPTAEPRQRKLDEAAVLGESISDEFDVESLLETDDALSFRRRDIGPEVVRKLRRGVWALQAQLDLHGLRRDEARERLGQFLRDAERAGLRCVRIIHGKGNGSPGREPVLKSKVRNWLVQRNEVLAFTQARAADGGHGAVIVLLRSSDPNKRP
ncbi:MAG: Smr/MutS family protein [Rhizobacter sp.]